MTVSAVTVAFSSPTGSALHDATAPSATTAATSASSVRRPDLIASTVAAPAAADVSPAEDPAVPG